MAPGACHARRGGTPLDKPVILSQLNGNIQDVFNEYGVQIMSPNFVLQPAASVGVPRDKWYAAPAHDPDQSRL